MFRVNERRSHLNMYFAQIDVIWQILNNPNSKFPHQHTQVSKISQINRIPADFYVFQRNDGNWKVMRILIISCNTCRRLLSGRQCSIISKNTYKAVVLLYSKAHPHHMPKPSKLMSIRSPIADICILLSIGDKLVNFQSIAPGPSWTHCSENFRHLGWFRRALILQT